MWGALSKRDFDAWVWSGDAVYAKGRAHDVGAVKRAFDVLLGGGEKRSTTPYATFAAKSVGKGGVMGTWDDHDLGANDAGSDATALPERQQLFLDFLGVPATSPRRSRAGVYASHLLRVGTEPGKRIKVILLDTRSGRSSYVIPSMGAWLQGTLANKFFALASAAVRFASAYSGLTTWDDERRRGSNKRAARAMLSEEQWRWLHAQLAASDADVHVVVSSVQVLTSTPTVESWGHFPSERARLLRLFKETKPRGLVVLSGDVHIGELLAVSPVAASPLEVTSSGMTHSCVGTLPTDALCNVVWKHTFPAPNRRGVWVGRNFGQIDVDWRSRTMNVSVWDLEPPSYAMNGSATEPKLLLSRALDAPFEDVFPADVGEWDVAGVVPSSVGPFIVFYGGVGVALGVAMALLVWLRRRLRSP